MLRKDKNYDWVLDVLIDLNRFCENEGLEKVSNPLVQAIEEIAPMLRTPPEPRARTSKVRTKRDARPKVRQLRLVYP